MKARVHVPIQHRAHTRRLLSVRACPCLCLLLLSVYFNAHTPTWYLQVKGYNLSYTFNASVILRLISVVASLRYWGYGFILWEERLVLVLLDRYKIQTRAFGKSGCVVRVNDCWSINTVTRGIAVSKEGTELCEIDCLLRGHCIRTVN